MNVYIYKSARQKINDTEFEVVETKGLGHPDNLCDTIAEKISAAYSKYCLENYGTILRHMVDKITILGGGSKVSFGHGEMTAPIRLLLNGRFTNNFNGEIIDYKMIVGNTVKAHFKKVMPLLDTDKWVKIIDNTHLNEGPGVVYDKNNVTKNVRASFFSVNKVGEEKHHNNKFRTNDTSTTVGYYPLSKLEQIVVFIEHLLNSDEFKSSHPFVGTDIKVMAIRHGNEIEITSCVPFIADLTPTEEFYQENLLIINNKIISLLKVKFPDYHMKLFLNTRDNSQNHDFYLTAIGSAVESGDEGAIGRGNRSNGVIAFTRNMSIEAPSGKNPVYHTGKIYTAIGNKISKEIYEKYNFENTVYLTSKMGGEMRDPWCAAVELYGVEQDPDDKIKAGIETIIQTNLDHHQDMTMSLINGDSKVYN